MWWSHAQGIYNVAEEREKWHTEIKGANDKHRVHKVGKSTELASQGDGPTVQTNKQANKQTENQLEFNSGVTE